MKQSELIKSLADRTGTTQQQVGVVLKSLGGLVHEQLLARDSVPLPGIGKLSTKDVPARVIRNIKTGAPINVPAKIAPKFTASKELKEAVA